ncbi:hypothetical protein U9M48_007454 [Paspalum notatum var. saurae]|uniref:Endonuclease/exonuclease/phosphatase domain-containing protein n=1 Tax=Paspalum notatum var. saurae TaxID=547442 RepID=A0AAQ3Q0J6_PASNO
MTTLKDALLGLIDGLRSLRRRRRTKGQGPRVVIRRPGAGSPDDHGAARRRQDAAPSSAPVATIRVATFNAAMFSMAPAVPPPAASDADEYPTRSTAGARVAGPTKGILKARRPPSPVPVKQQQLRVSINLVQDDKITAKPERSRSNVNAAGGGSITSNGGTWKGKAVADEWMMSSSSSSRRSRSVAEVLREVGADIIGLQNVRAEEERGMRPLSDLAEGLGMRYVFAESWAPEYGNAVLSRWPIKRWKAHHRLADHSDFRNVLRVTVDVPGAGEVNFHCTHLDHLDESLRMKQLSSILRSADGHHHILAGDLNALDSTDYTADRWADIVKYYAEIGKPTPKTEVMRYLKKVKRYVDAKDFAGECEEAAAVVAKGQDVQGTCRYGTRVDYILTSPNSPYKFIPGSYAIVSSKGTSDHHIVKADLMVADNGGCSSRRQRVVRMSKGSMKGIWAAR